MNLDINPNELSKQLKRIGYSIRSYASIIFFVSILIIYSMLVWQIGALSRAVPGDDEVSEQLKTVARPKINQETIDKIQQLRDQNVAVETLFKEARNNPFQE